MKKIIRIARLELSILFYSPIAWLVLIIFTFQSAHQFIDLLHQYQQELHMGIKVTDLTRRLFGQPFGLFPQVTKYLYLYIPLLTMGLMSRETSSGSINLLLSSPVKNRQIVLGKFAAMMAYGLLLIGVLVLLVSIASFSIVNLDVTLILSGLLGLYLLLCVYAAIGLFLSCLTSYQIIAAISTLAMLAVLNYIGQVGQRIDVVRDLTWFLSLSGRIDPFIDGLLSTRDLIYFLLIIGLFLGLSIMKLRASRESKPFVIKAGRVMALITAILVIIYVSSRPSLTGYYDMTATRARTLTANSQAVVRQMKLPLKITTYVNLLDQYAGYFGFPERKNEDKARFEYYQRYMPDIKMNYAYYYDSSPSRTLYKRNPGLNNEQIAKKMAYSYNYDLNMFLSPEKMRKVIDLGPENYKFVRLLEYGDKKTFLRIYADQDIFPSEQEITAAFKRLIVAAPVIAFLTGNNERSINKRGDQGYLLGTIQKNFRYALINQGFDVIELAAGQPIPDTIAALVLADPATALDTGTLQRIKDYIGKGGNMVIAGEACRQDLVNPVCRQLGIQLLKGQLVEKSKDYAPDLIFAGFANHADEVEPAFRELMTDSVKTSLPGAVALQYNESLPADSPYSTGFRIRPLVVSDSSTTWNKIGAIDSSSDDVIFHPEEGDIQKTFPLILSLTRTIHDKEQRIIVSGDADFMSNSELARGRNANPYLFTDIFRWMSYEAFPIDVTRPVPKDNNLKVDKKEIKWLKFVFLFMIPLLTGIWCTILLIRRSRK